jgi:LmbE family N-acetylglucosaminyl deacetylase
MSGDGSALKLLCVLAHPDDESLGVGGILARYAAEGVETYVITATRGERGWFGPSEEYPGPQELGRIRERELADAAKVLGVREVTLLDYHDGELDQADHVHLTRQLVGHIRRIRPHVVVAFDHNGVYGHPDHIAATRAANAAVVAAADHAYSAQTPDPVHAVPKLYYFAWTDEVRQAYEAAFGELVMNVDGAERRAVPWPHWAISTWIDTSAHWNTVWEAIRCHRSQLPGYHKLLDLPDEYHETLWGQLTFHRVYSLVPAPDREDDMFAGLRVEAAS